MKIKGLIPFLQKNSLLFLSYLLLVVLPYLSYAQTTPKLPAFYTITEHAYDFKDGLTDLYAPLNTTLIDRKSFSEKIT